jgi:c-di-GMP-binding flagellar brake protein YcgR
MLTALKQLLEGVVAFFQERSKPSADERRRLIRLRCQYTVQCVVEEEQFAAEVADMGLNGMRLKLDQRLKAGSKIFVYHPAQVDRVENEYVLCQVRWCRKRRDAESFEAGLQYVDTPGNMRRSWVKFLLKELGFDERAIYTRRKSIRAEARLSGVLLGEDGRKHEGTVINLGAGGALFEGHVAPAHGSSIRLRLGPWLRFRALEVPGVALHSKRTREGGPYLVSIRFDELKPAQVRSLGQYVVTLLRAVES